MFENQKKRKYGSKRDFLYKNFDLRDRLDTEFTAS